MKPITNEYEFKKYMSDSALKISRIMFEMIEVAETYELENNLSYGDSFELLALDSYPFSLSFDEQANLIYGWADDILDS